MKTNRNIWVYPAAVFTMLIWGTTFIWYKLAFRSFGPLSVVFLRLLIASLLLTIYNRLFRKNQSVRPGDLGRFFLLSFCEPFLYFIGESCGLQYVSASTGAIIIALIPLVTPFFAYRFLKEKIGWSQIAGLIISFCGVTMIISGDFQGSDSLKGVLLLLMAVLAAVGYGLMLKPLSHRYNAFSIVKIQSIIGTVLFLPLFLIVEGKAFFSSTPDLQAIITIFQLALFGSTLAFIMITYVIRHIGLNNTNIFTNLIPVFAALISFLVLKETFPALKIIGMFIVLAGLILSQIKGAPRDKDLNLSGAVLEVFRKR